MMKMPSEEIVVVDLAGDVVKLYSASYARDDELCKEGFRRSGSYLNRAIANDVDRRCIVKFLIGIDALFSSGRDWSPEEIVDMYNEHGFVDQGYRIISWIEPDRYVISARRLPQSGGSYN